MIKKNFKIDQITNVAKKLADTILLKKPERATVVALSGELGVGKTALIQELGKIFGVKEKMVSPTFVIIKNYELKIKNYFGKNLIHIDAYRLESEEELLNLGWEDIISNPDHIVFIEWPERVPNCIPKEVINVKLEHIDEETRNIQIML